jgi:hypothetical protein
VRTELVYVPAGYELATIDHLITGYLKPGGRLILANTMEGMDHPEGDCLPGSFACNDILAHLDDPDIKPAGYRDGYDPVKNRENRFTIVTIESLISGGPYV